MAVIDRVRTMNAYRGLLTNPLATLRQNVLVVNTLPAANDASVTNLWFAFRNGDMVIDVAEATACALVNGNQDCAIQQRMVVSPMRGHGLPVDAVAGGRHRATGVIHAGAGASLWVTEMQTGCTVLILNWGGGQYSMTHLQPSQDNQFNLLGRALMDLGRYTRPVTGEHLFRNSYKNAWLKQESTWVVGNTGGTPQYYIMVQSMFAASRGTATQLVGVAQGPGFEFYRQRTNGNNIQAERLTWSGWYNFLPYFTY